MIPDDAVGVIRIDTRKVLTKAKMVDGEKIVVPDDLKKLINESDVNVIGDIIYHLPYTSVDLNNDCYIFFSPGIYKAVALIPLLDEEAALKIVEKISSSKVGDVEGVDFASHLDYAYAVENDVLFVGRLSNPVDATVAASAANSIIEKNKPSIFVKKDICEYFDNDSSDVNAYIDIKGFCSILKNNSRFSTAFGYVPVLDIITDSDIKAMTLALNFDMSKETGECAKLVTNFIYDKKGQYSKLYDNMIVADSAMSIEVLQCLPGELDAYVGARISGVNLASQPAMTKMFEILESETFTAGMNFKNILSSIKGPIVFAFGNSQIGDFNFAVATHSKDPEMIVNQIVDVANSRGQSPWSSGGEYIYDHGNQGIALGQDSSVVYLRCVDFETSYSASELPVLPANIKKSVIVYYKQLKIGDNIEGIFNWGLHDKTNGTGLYFTENENQNVVVSLIKYLCWKQPEPTSEEDVDDSFDYGF